MTSVAMFNNKGGVGKTTLTFHLAHMLQRLGHRVLAVDLDPQANLTAAFLDEDDLAVLWREPDTTWTDRTGVSAGPTVVTRDASTVAMAVQPIMEGLGDITAVEPLRITDGLWLLPGDLNLSAFEDKLSDSWPRSFTGDDLAAIRTTTAFHRIIQAAQRLVDADLVLVDVGPNLGAINRSALLATDTVLVPMAADLFSLRGLRNLGPALRAWRTTWQDTVRPRIPDSIPAPTGGMIPLGYVIMQPIMRLDRPVQAYQRWLDRIPEAFSESVLGRPSLGTSPYEIATLRNYRSLMPLAYDARKPMFDLRSADGALGSTQRYVQQCYQDFQSLATEVVGRIDAVDRPVRD